MEKGDELARAKQSVERLLKYRLRSEKEIIDNLHKKSFSEPAIREIIGHFKSMDLIDDRKFTKGWIRSRLNKPYGLTRIKYELKQKGVDAALINEECAHAFEQYDEHEALRTLIVKRSAQYRHLAPLKAKQRLYGYLSRRGFSNGVIIKALKAFEDLC